MSNSEVRTQLAQLAEHQIACARQLLGILSREKDALDARATDIVIGLANEKEHVAAQLEELVIEQRQLSELLDGDVPALADNDAASVVRRDELRELLRACHHQNVVNGSVIELGRRFTEQLLGTIRGTSSQGTLYGPQGKALRLTGAERFSKA